MNCVRKRSRLAAFRTLIVAMLVALVGPAFAWKPATHILAANIAVAPVMAGNNYVTVDGKNYAVDSRVADSIRAFPSYYRAGVCGPDLYPDMVVGQSVIHPDTKLGNGSESPGDFSAGHSFSYEWLRHIFEGGWAYYNNHGGDEDGQKILAFTYGFLTHSAGDMWAHTLVNSFARGFFPDITDLANIGISIRHIVIESGYIGSKTPPTDVSIAHDSPVLSEFIYNTMIAGGKEGGFVDSANNDTWSLGHGPIFGFFLNLRWALDDRVAALDGLGPLNPVYLLTLPLNLYMDAWVDDIDDGLKAWPDMSQKIGNALVGTVPMDWSGAGDAIDEFIFDHVLSMIGFPDFAAEIMEVIHDIMEAFSELIEPLKDAAKELRNWLVLQATGIDIEEVKDYIANPANHINNPVIGLGPDTSAKLDALMGIPAGDPDAKFNPETFAAFKNTVTTSALVLCTPEALNQMLYDHRVGPMFQSGSPNSDKDNFMLGFIHTLDGHEQWRKTTDVTYPNSPSGSPMSEGMPIWSDCLARDRVFRVIYKPWPGQDFNDNGEGTDDISATPPPTSALAVLGAQYSNGGITYIGGAATFQVSGSPDHFWNANEISVDGQIAPGGSPVSGSSPITLGPIGGADGVYTVTYKANGLCVSGDKHPETAHTASFTRDGTPPTVTIPQPAANLILDVVQTSPFHFQVVDGGSGVKSSAATLDGKPILEGAVIDAFYLTYGVHTLVANGTDNVGNQGTITRTFKVQATIAGLKAAITKAYALKLWTLPKTDNSIQTKLDAAQKALDTGKVATAKNNLDAAANQVVKGIGAGIDPAFGNRFVGWCRDLSARL